MSGMEFISTPSVTVVSCTGTDEATRGSSSVEFFRGSV
jgi:hypothetical protein